MSPSSKENFDFVSEDQTDTAAIVLGGTVTSGREPANGAMVSAPLEPSHAMERVWDSMDGRQKNQFEKIHMRSVEAGPLDSSDLVTKTTEMVVQDVRELLLNYPNLKNFLLFFGTDQFEDLLTALNNGVPEKWMRGKTILGVCAKDDMDSGSQDAIKNAINGFSTVKNRLLRGRIPLLSGNAIYPGRGTVKICANEYPLFRSRYPLLARIPYLQSDEPVWFRDKNGPNMDFSDRDAVHEPIGDPDPDYMYKISGQIGEVKLTSSSDYSDAEMFAAVNQRYNQSGGNMKGMVLTLPGPGNYRTNEKDQTAIRRMSELEIPIATSGAAITKWGTGSATYEGDASLVPWLNPTSIFPSAEVRLFMEQAIAEAESKGMEKRGIVRYVQERFEWYKGKFASPIAPGTEM